MAKLSEQMRILLDHFDEREKELEQEIVRLNEKIEVLEREKVFKEEAIAEREAIMSEAEESQKTTETPLKPTFDAGALPSYQERLSDARAVAKNACSEAIDGEAEKNIVPFPEVEGEE